jgi:NAD(P)-dependent dehydrogenase (short-subunit alcohol dehydrogenase family)
VTSLTGKVAVVTGGEQPLVQALATALAEAGAAIALLGDARELGRCVADLEARDTRAVAVGCDFATREAVETGFGEAADGLQGPVDAVLHGWMPEVAFEPIDFVAVDDDRWESTWEAPMLATIFVLQAAFTQMRGRGGHIVVVTPTVSMSGAARLAPYTATVEAQRVLAKSAARQWGSDRITVNCLAPAPEHVPIGVESMTVSLAPPALGGPGDARRDLGGAAAFLAGEGSHFVTGATVAVDGGVWMMP